MSGALIALTPVRVRPFVGNITGCKHIRINSAGQRARPTATIAREPQLMRFQPFSGQGGSSTGSAAVVAFCVSGRCFDWRRDAEPTARGSLACGGGAVRIGASALLETSPPFKASSGPKRRIDASTWMEIA